ncbi:glycosyltransferase [Calidifontibacillus erzurumensis]|uniref:Glycosyltransferase n=1 Tax=Calidifontibacillus erzurumensis TaxID=2741433 RepID=A0A8J8GF24_9BACI|nr:glycosyltransferase [Calidifontibacillus erzurumensis]NSL52729.1 glycosyltransferase [Calidifontibacillus erzurumensis]
MTKISIIVPIYNVEKYLRRCIESIQKQTLKDIQIILVNDGSKDNSLAICKEYGAVDERIVVIDQPNGGVSSARNAGLEVAKGEYIGFIDPDDWIEANMYESLYKQAKNIDADVCMCDYIIEKNGKSVPIKMNINKDNLEGEEIIKKIIANMIGSSNLNSGSQTIMGSVWRIIAKRDLLEKNQLKFKVGIPLMEDLLFCIEILLKSKKVGVNRGAYYHYLQHGHSAVASYRKNMLELQLKVYYFIQEILSKENIYPIVKERMDVRYVSMYLTAIANEARKENKKNIIDKVAYIKELCKDPLLKNILKEINTNGYTFRKKLILKAIKNEFSWFLYFYYSALLRLLKKQ